MSQNGQIHFKNLAANAARFESMSNHFGILSIKRLNVLKGMKKFRKLTGFVKSQEREH